jgi:DNA end-binding protein Ku
VIRDAMRGKDMVALGRVVIAKRERVIALEPHDKGLLGTTLRYPYEVREAAGYFEDVADIKIPADMRKLAEHILDSKATDFDPSTFVDQYEVALVDLLKKKEAGVQPPKAAAAAPDRRVVNLMDALRKSIESETPRKPAAGQAAARRQSSPRKRANF